MTTISGNGNFQLEPSKVAIIPRQGSGFAVQNIMAAARFSRMCGEIQIAQKEQPLCEIFDGQTRSVPHTVTLIMQLLSPASTNTFVS